MYKSKFVHLIIGVLLGQSVAAQNNNPLAGKDTMILENERIFDIKNSDKPELAFPVREIKTPDFTEIEYLSKDFYFDAQPELSAITPTPYSTKVDSGGGELYYNYLKAGLGQFLTPYGEIFLSHRPNSPLRWTVNARHYSAHADVIRLRQFREEMLKAHLGKYGNGKLWEADLQANNQAYHLYANFKPKELFSDTLKDSLSRNFTNVNANFNLTNKYHTDEDGLVYEAKTALQGIWDSKIYRTLANNSEYNLLLLPKLAYYFNGNWGVGGTMDLTYSFASLAGKPDNRLFLKAKPYARYKHEKLHLKTRLGASVNYFMHPNAANNSFFISPFGDVTLDVMPERLSVFVGYDGEMHNNTYYQMLTTCWYLDREAKILPTTDRMNIFVGAFGNIRSKFDWNAKLHYKRIQNPLLMYGRENGRFIGLMYDSLTTNVGLHLEAVYGVIQTIQLGGAFDYNYFKTTTAPAYFGISPIQFKLFGRLQFMDTRLNIHPELFLYSPTPMGLDAGDKVVFRGFMPDLSAKADYRISPRFSVFFHAQNMLGVRYFRYLNYPERRWNFLGGIGFIF